MNPSRLALAGSIPGLLRWCSPVTLPSGDRDGAHKSVVLYFAESGEYATASRTGGLWVFYKPDDITLDLTDPTGRLHALLWLKERGHDLAWAMEEPDVLAWSVLSVARGGKAIRDVLNAWTDIGGGRRASMRRDTHAVFVAASGSTLGTGFGWDIFGDFLPSGPETGPAGRAAADRAALKANYALRNEDGTLTLPELPRV